MRRLIIPNLIRLTQPPSTNISTRRRFLKLSTKQQALTKLRSSTPINRQEDQYESIESDHRQEEGEGEAGLSQADYLKEFGFNEESLSILQSEGFITSSESYQEHLDSYIDSNTSAAGEEYDYEGLHTAAEWEEFKNSYTFSPSSSSSSSSSPSLKPPSKSKPKRLPNKSKSSTPRPSGTTSTRPIPTPLPSVPYSPPDPSQSSSNSSTQPPLINPYRPLLTPSYPWPQPHEFPLRSSNDWRLSSPILSRTSIEEPVDLYLPQESELIKAVGHNKLVGVGPDCAREARRWKLTKDESWSEKHSVPKDEGRGQWASGDAYVKKQTRLLELTDAADEITYLSELAKSGTVKERASKGLTIPKATGGWQGESKLVDLELRKAESKRARKIEKEEEGMIEGEEAEVWEGEDGRSMISVWESDDGKLITQEEYKPYIPGAFLRFTLIGNNSKDTGPQLSYPASGKKKGVHYYQGLLLEIKEGKLVVSFDVEDMFVISGQYRIDIGRDESSLKLQLQALRSLYFDPFYQRLHNLKEVEETQSYYLREVAKIGTSSSTLNDLETPSVSEWTLKGTDIREIIVPDLEEDANYYETTIGGNSNRSSFSMPEYNVWDELEALDTSTSSLPALLPPHHSSISPPMVSQNKSSLFTDNQMMNSWIQRYRKEGPPLVMTGDPDIGLNPSQTRAIAMSLDENISLIQGPPGTGKSQTLVSLIHLLKVHFRHPSPILLAAPTHVSVDHLLANLIATGLNPLRTGKAAKVRDGLKQWTVEKRREEHPLWLRCEEARIKAEEKRLELGRLNNVLKSARKLNNKETQQLADDIKSVGTLFRKALYRFRWLEHRLYSSLLATADVFVSTALGAGKSRIMSFVDFPIVFIDEAAMCTEPVTLIPLMKGARHVTLIGDHMQLPAVMTSKQAKLERLHVSLFERLMDSKKVNSVLLSTQYRMRPTISEFPNRAFYLSALSDAPSVLNRPPPPLSKYFNTPPNATSPAPNVFIGHNYPESSSNNSTVNKGEVKIVVDIVGDLLKRNPTLQASDIGIITFYAAQTRLLSYTFQQEASETLYSLLGPHRANTVNEVEVNTVDGFQGREKSIIILSTVRSNQGGWIGFLNDKRRLNVALTRAKNGLFVVGNKRTLKMATEGARYKIENDQDTDSDIWRRYLRWVEQNGLIRDWESSVL